MKVFLSPNCGKNGFGRDEEAHGGLNLLGGGSNGTQVKLTVIKMEGS